MADVSSGRYVRPIGGPDGCSTVGRPPLVELQVEVGWPLSWGQRNEGLALVNAIWSPFARAVPGRREAAGRNGLQMALGPTPYLG